MSTRQRQRITKDKNIEIVLDSDEDAEEYQTVKKNVFEDFSSEDESDSSSSSSVQPSVAIESPKHASRERTPKKSNSVDFSVNAVEEREDYFSAVNPVNPLFLIEDEKTLDVESLIRKRFGGGVQRSSGSVGRKSSKRTFLFGQQQTNWTKPCSLVAGGFGMRACNPPEYFHSADQTSHWFEYIWSDEYRAVNNEFCRVRDSGDVNLLIRFLAEQPYHVEGLLQLAMIFARIGEMDKASDFTRQSLFCLEYAFPESFRPTLGTYRMDPTTEENNVLFVALFRHMQLSCMMGCPGAAADIGRLLLSLCVEGDPQHVLLTLDHFFVTSGKLSMLLQFTGAHTLDGNSSSSKDTVLSWSNAVEIGMSVSDVKDGIVSESEKLSLQHLPNWWFSLSLALFNHERAVDSSGKRDTDTSGVIESFPLNSLECLKRSLLQWPFMLEPLMKASGIEGKSIAWRAVRSHKYFVDSSTRLPENSVLSHIAQIFATRNGTIWNREEVHHWLQTAATSVITDEDRWKNALAHQVDYYKFLSQNLCLLKYKNASLEDFQETYPRLPADANPIDPNFADPRQLRGQRDRRGRHNNNNNNNNNNRRALNPPRANHVRHPEQVDWNNNPAFNNIDIQAELNRLRGAGVNITWDELVQQIQHFGIMENNRVQNGGNVGTNVDLEAPLAQLFWQTMLPWNRVVGHRNEG